MSTDRVIDIVRETRAAYESGIEEGERRAAERVAAAEQRVAELEAELRRRTRMAS